jgi:hypothetical protein
MGRRERLVDDPDAVRLPGWLSLGPEWGDQEQRRQD